MVITMYPEYFTLHESIVDRDDLTIYEKMCCVVLARYIGKDEFKDILSKDIIAMKMGCNNDEAYKAIKGLINKGILEEESEEELASDIVNSKVIREIDSDHVKNIQFTELNSVEIIKENTIDFEIEKKIEEVRDILEEVVSEKAIKILLNIAGGDVDLIKKKYAIAKMSQLNDVMEVLMHELQKKEPKIVKITTDTVEQTKNIPNQINQKRITELYKKKNEIIKDLKR